MSKTHRQLILEVLSNAEIALLEIVSRAAASGDYSGIDLARGTAEQIKGIATRLSCEQPRASIEKIHKGKRKDRHEKRAASKLAAKKIGYPRFEIRESTLTKVGWSKKQNQEYTHRISRDAFEAVVGALAASQRRKDGPLSTELILELLAASGQAPPFYQTYSVLGFLRSKDVIRSSARGEYVVPSDIDGRARSEWLKEERTNT